MDPLPRAYHVFEWLSIGKIAHVNSQQWLTVVDHGYTPPFCFVKHILVFTKDQNHSHIQSFIPHSFHFKNISHTAN